MKKLAQLLCAMGLLGLAACTTGGLYHPASSPRSSGYSEQKLETNRWRITFVGSNSTTAGTVQDYALLRAAELTLNMGYEWFSVAGRSTVNQDNGYSYGPRFSGMFGPPCGAFGCGSGLYGGFWYDDYDDSRLSASLDIVMGKGPKPGDPLTYDAKDVANTIRASMGNRY